MDLGLDKSVVLVTSQSEKESQFGSGFVVHCDDDDTYLITCAHVVRDVGGSEQVRVGKKNAVVVALGNSRGCDLAVIKVSGRLQKIPLKLSIATAAGRQITIAGYSQNETKMKTLRNILGRLGEKVTLEFEGEQTIAWDIEIDEGSRHSLKPGYSGSPVIDIESGKVIAVTFECEGVGKQGKAIAVEEITNIWQDIPSSLLQEELDSLSSKIAVERSRIEQLSTPIEQIEKSLIEGISPESKQVLKWLSTRGRLAQKACREVMRQVPELKEHLDDEKKFQDFCFDVEMYLELIYYSLVTKRFHLLQKSCVSPSLPVPNAYVKALNMVKLTIPQEIVGSAKEEAEARFDYLAAESVLEFAFTLQLFSTYL